MKPDKELNLKEIVNEVEEEAREERKRKIAAKIRGIVDNVTKSETTIEKSKASLTAAQNEFTKNSEKLEQLKNGMWDAVPKDKN